jgi:hypothetical protein
VYTVVAVCTWTCAVLCVYGHCGGSDTAWKRSAGRETRDAHGQWFREILRGVSELYIGDEDGEEFAVTGDTAVFGA